MDYRRLFGIILIILGVLFVAYPLLSVEAVSIVAGVCLIAFGIASIFDGFSFLSMLTHITLAETILGILLIILGFLFLIDLAPLAFLVAHSFYLIGFILVFIGLLGIFAKESDVSKWGSVVILILGIVFFILGFLSITDPLFIAILVGICLMIRGAIYVTVGKAFDKINDFEGQ